MLAMRRTALFSLLLILAGCGSHSSSPVTSTPALAPADPWTMTSHDTKAETPALLWNGQIGLRIGADGTGAGSMFLIDAYEAAGEEKILPQPNLLAATWKAGTAKTTLSPVGATDYSQVLDMKTGVLTTSWSQQVDSKGVKVKVESLVHATMRVVAQRWTINSDGFIELAYDCPAPAQTTIDNSSSKMFLADWYLPGQRKVSEHDSLVGDAHVAAAKGALPWMASNGIFVSAAADKGKPLTFTRTLFVGRELSSKSAISLGEVKSDEFKARIVKSEPFGSVLEDHLKQFAAEWKTDIEIDGPVEDQQAIRSFVYYLRGAISPYGEMSVSPMGLSSDIYFGHVFWDADIWVFPALALTDPERAAAISRYRLDRGNQASANFQGWVSAERPTASGKMGPVTLDGLLTGEKYPWESSVSGKETVPGPSQFEEHISGSVVFSLKQSEALGLISKSPVFQVGSYYATRAVADANGLREIRATVSPDEHHTGDNDLYTNLLAMWSINEGKWPEKPTFKLPKDDQTFLTYDNDRLKSYKQAAAVLSIYPLQYPPAEAQAKTMMDRFADKVIKNGPAMTDSVHALIWARLSEAEKAYATWHESWKPFMREPFLLFSEKRSSSRTYFTTGAGGCLQTVLYGFAGIRIDTRKAPGAKWSTPLKAGYVLSVAPHLPSDWKKLTLRGIHILGRSYTFQIAGSEVNVNQDK